MPPRQVRIIRTRVPWPFGRRVSRAWCASCTWFMESPDHLDLEWLASEHARSPHAPRVLRSVG
jgi:hypothetical protein